MVPSDHRAVLTPAAGSTRQPCLSLTLTLDKRRIELHGSLIAELMLRRALNRQSTLVRSYARQFRAWLDRRDIAASSKQNDAEFDRNKRWDISIRDVAATVEATFLIESPRAGLRSLLGWTPRVVALRAAEIFVPRLLARGRADLVSPLLADHSIPDLFKAWIAVPLARAGHRVGAETFRQILEDPRLPRLLKIRKLSLGLSCDGSEPSLGHVRDAVQGIRGDEYRISLHGRSRLFELLSLNLFDLCTLSKANVPAILHLAGSVFGDKVSQTGHQLLPLFRLASTNAAAHTAVLKWVSERDIEIAALLTTASEKSDAFIALARLTAPISDRDAEVLFAHAHEATEDIDADARFQLRALGALLERAVPSLSGEERKRLACYTASIVTSAAIRIRNEDGFPWGEVVRAITNAHAGTAFAAIAQWEDRSLAQASETLVAALKVFRVPHLSAAELQLAMNPLLESGHLLRSALKASVAQSTSGEVLNDICRDALQFGTDEDKVEVSRLLEASEEPNVWLARFRTTARLLASLLSGRKADHGSRATRSREATVDLPSSTFTSVEAIAEVVENAKKQKLYVPVSSVLIAMGKKVTPANRVPHLAALVDLCEFDVRGDDIVEALEIAHREWQSPAVSAWIEEAVPRMLQDHLPAFVGLVVWDREHATVDRLLRLVRKTEHLVRALVGGLGKEIDVFDAGTIYELCRRLFAMIEPKDAQAVLTPYVERLRSSVPPEDNAGFAGSDIPDSPDAVLARYLFTLMSDVDTRIRWRAAHCLRRLVRYGDDSLVPAIAGLWSRQSEKTFRAPDAPFYWQAARLWLVTSLSRIAVDSPKSIAPAVSFLVAAIRDEAFPHPAVRSFCQDTLRSLQESGVISLSGSDRELVEATNQTNLPRIKRDWQGRSDRNRSSSSRRWDFDALDTTPYWIDPTSSIFAKVSAEELANEAERWIINRWKVSPSFDKWRAEPRQSRFSDRDYGLRSNDHGSMPTIEDYRTYLEWYSLQCAVGSLMRTEALSKTEYEDGEDEFEERLARQKLTESPYWLADLLSTRPPAARFWSKPGAIDEWLAEISERDFLEELSRGESGEDLVICGRADVHSSEFSWDAHIESALVEPSNALALVRALQTADEPLDFKLPEAGPERYGRHLSFSETGFVLEGWVRFNDSDERFDEGDPLCFGISRTRFAPFEHCEKPTLAPDGILVWPPTKGITFSYERWKDQRDLTDRDYEGPEIRTSGNRLYATQMKYFPF
jgi:hypothetical protein